MLNSPHTDLQGRTGRRAANATEMTTHSAKYSLYTNYFYQSSLLWNSSSYSINRFSPTSKGLCKVPTPPRLSDKAIMLIGQDVTHVSPSNGFAHKPGSYFHTIYDSVSKEPSNRHGNLRSATMAPVSAVIWLSFGLRWLLLQGSGWLLRSSNNYPNLNTSKFQKIHKSME